LRVGWLDLAVCPAGAGRLGFPGGALRPLLHVAEDPVRVASPSFWLQLARCWGLFSLQSHPTVVVLELTVLPSFLLIGYWHTAWIAPPLVHAWPFYRDGRAAGLCLLAGIAMVGIFVGNYIWNAQCWHRRYDSRGIRFTCQTLDL